MTCIVNTRCKSPEDRLKKRETQCSDIILKLKDIIIPGSINH